MQLNSADEEARRDKLVEDLSEKLTECANVFMHSPEAADLGMAEVTSISVYAALNALVTFAFTKLSEQGVADGEEIIESLAGAFKHLSRAALAVRKSELEQESDSSSKELPSADPWD